jgi:hypothetical protein
VAKELKARIAVRVHPQAKRSRVTGVLDTTYKLDVAAPATDGRANDACIDLLSKLTRVQRAKIRMVTGQTSRSKVFEFEGMDLDELRRRLDQGL